MFSGRAGLSTSAFIRELHRNTHRSYPFFQSYAPALIILSRRQYLATETSASSTGSTYPPPGFDANAAKRPIPDGNPEKSEGTSKTANAVKAPQDSDTLKKQIKIPGDIPTSDPKTRASEIQTLTELAAEKTAADRIETIKGAEKKKEEKRLTIWQKVKKEANHYWDGTKLLVTEVRISSKLALKMAAGYELTRREHRQLHRTVQDLGRLIPFSVFVIVPFAELLLPVALKLFPNLLPSTYEGQKAKDAKATNLRATRKEVGNFLRQTLKETGLPVSAASAQKEEFAEFFRKIRTTGESPTPSDVIKVCKIFKDDLTLDNLSRPQLVGICRYMNMTSFGTDNFLRYQIRHRMRQIKRDDRAISFEGVESLSVPELQTACASRGLRTYGVSPARLRDDLQMWLDLRLKYGVPSTLLVLSNAFMYAQGKESEIDSQVDALQAVLSSIPEELYHEIELEVHSAEGAATNKQRLEVLKEQQTLIEEENEQNIGGESAGRTTPKDRDNIDEEEAVSKNEGEGEVVEASTEKAKEDAESRLKKVEHEAAMTEEEDRLKDLQRSKTNQK